MKTRLRRFISNPRIDMAESCERLDRSVIRALTRKKLVILLVDETSLQDRLKAIGRIRRIRGAGDPGGDDDAPSDSVADGAGRDDSDDAQVGSGRSGRGAETWS